MYYKLCYKNVLVVSLAFISIWTSYIPQVDSCWGSTSTNIGAMTPDQKLLDGTELTIECSLNNNTIEYNKTLYEVNSSMISFKFQNEYYREDRVHIINSTVAELVVNKASIADNGMYFCLLNISGLDHHPLVCVSHVTVGYKPQPVTDFKCISLHYRKLHCSWTPPTNPIPTSYHLEDRIHTSSSLDYLSRNCGNTPSENSCEWTTDSVPPYRNTALKFNLLLNGENQFGVNSQLFVVDHYSIIKPNIPKNLMASEVTTNNISLSWKAPEYIEYDEELLADIIYEIQYFRIVLNNDKSRTVIIDGIHKTSIVLTNLIPFINYNISIRCKTKTSTSDEYWSEFSSILVTTKPDVPYLAPDLIPESFQTDKNMEGMRSITLFWKHIPFEYRNGKDFHYWIEYNEKPYRKSRAKSNAVDRGSDEMITSVNTTYTFNHMRSDVAYSFKIHGVNAQGVSKNYSTITVEKNDVIPHKPSNIDVYSFGGGRYEVQWGIPRYNSLSGSIVNYTVFWCQNLRPRPFACEGAIEWIHTNNKSIALELPDIQTNYQFAVSANSLVTSSGMSWAECIVPIDGRLDKLSEVHVKVHNSTSIGVNWKLNCPAQKRVVEGYKIKFCKIEDYFNRCMKPEYTRADNSVESYTLNGLQPFTKYIVTVVALSDSGPSEESDPKYATTPQDAPEDPPSGLEVLEKTGHSVTLQWTSPKRTNGQILHYEVLYNGNTFIQSADNCTFCMTTLNNLESYRNHSIRVRACNSEALCSPFASHSVITLASTPHRMDPPRSEIINSTSVRISWSPPVPPNGPIDYYTLKLIRSDNSTEIFNISGKQREYYLSLDCDLKRDDSKAYQQQYAVEVSSVNIGTNGSVLSAQYSESTNLNACLYPLKNFGYIIGLIGGGTLGLIILVMVLVVLVRWMKRRINSYNSLRIELPKGLEVPQLVTDGTDRDNSELFNQFGRTDSIPNITSGMILPVIEDSFKNRHGSGLSHTSNSSQEGLIYRNTTIEANDAFFRMASHDSGQHESVSSHCSGGEAHMSSDSGVEIDNQHMNSEPNDVQRVSKVIPKPPLPTLPILDEMSSRNSDSSGSKDSGLDITSGGVRSKRKRKPRSNKSNNKISAVVMPTNNEVMNPLYDTPMSHSVCIYSLLANSEPSLLEAPLRVDDNILSNLSKFTKPEMAKSLGNIIQSCNPSDPKVNCIICDTNNSSNRASTRTASPVCPYYKYGIKRQNHIPNNLRNFSPEKRLKTNATKTNTNGYITIDRILENGRSVASQPLKKRLEHDWSQNSYDAEVSSTSSNGDNEQTADIITQNNLFTQNSHSFTDCDKIQNINSLVDFEDNTELKDITSYNSIVKPLKTSSIDNMLNPIVVECETQLNDTKESIRPSNESTPLKTPTTPLVKDSNGYVLHNALNHLSANKMKANLRKNSNGYVVIDGIAHDIQMNDLVPNNTIVSHVTQV